MTRKTPEFERIPMGTSYTETPLVQLRWKRSHDFKGLLAAVLQQGALRVYETGHHEIVWVDVPTETE